MAGTTEKNQVGKREDLADLIAVADAADKPFLAMVPKGKKPANMLIEWQADKFDDPKMGGVADGVDVGTYEDGAKDRTRIKVYCQQFRRATMVGNIAEDVSNVAGASSGELARSLDKKREEIARDIESTLCSDQETQEEASAEAPYLLRGLGKWFLATAQAVLPVGASYLTPAASIDATAMASLTQTIFENILESVYNSHGKGESLNLLVGTKLKRAITGFTNFKGSDTNTYATIRAYNDSLDGGKITNNITAYEGDFNMVTIVPSLFLGRDTTTGLAQAATSRRGYLLAMDQVQLRYHTKPIVEPLPNGGGGQRAQIRAILGLQVGNPLRGGKFAGTA